MSEDYENTREDSEDLLSSTESAPPSSPRRNPISIGLPVISPRRRRSRETYCLICKETHILMSSKHRLCYDCLVDTLSTAKLFTQGFDITSKRRDKQMCIVCLNTVRHIGNKFMICIDCLIKRLGDVGLLNFNESESLHPIFIALDTDYSSLIGNRVDWQRKKYFPCDVCTRNNIDDKRSERLCLDCIIDNLLDTPYFKKTKRRIYF